MSDEERRSRVGLSRPDKLLFPDDGISKADLASYYSRIAPTMLAHVAGRPASLERYPDGIESKGFFHKDVGGEAPDWARTVTVPLRQGGDIEQIVLEDADTLALLADWGCITPHVWLSSARRLEHPLALVVDLDPPDAKSFDLVQEAAEDVRVTLAQLDLPSRVMTTGSKGLHVIVPLDGSATFETVRAFAERLAMEVAGGAPDRYTTAHRRDERGGRLYLDVARNAYGQTVVAPYSPRPIPGAPLACPLDWREARSSRMSAQKYTIGNVFRRLAQRDDPWTAAGTHGASLDRAAAALG